MNSKTTANSMSMCKLWDEGCRY